MSCNWVLYICRETCMCKCSAPSLGARLQREYSVHVGAALVAVCGCVHVMYGSTHVSFELFVLLQITVYTKDLVPPLVLVMCAVSTAAMLMRHKAGASTWHYNSYCVACNPAQDGHSLLVVRWTFIGGHSSSSGCLLRSLLGDHA
jgi:hypothetical protein